MGVFGTIKFVKDLYSNTVDFEDIMSVKLATVMATLRLWFSQRDYEKASLADKLLCNLLFIFEIIAFSGSLVYLLLHPREDPMDIVVQKLAHILMNYVGIFMMSFSRWYRREFSEVIDLVNEKTLQILEREDYLDHRPLRNRIYLAMILILIATTLADASSPIGFLLKTLTSGELFFKNVLLVDVPVNSVPVYLLAVLQILLFYYIYTFCTLFVVVIIEPFLRLAMCYKIIASDIKTLRKIPGFKEHEEFMRLRSLMKECNGINSLVHKANAMNSTFFLVYVLAMFGIISLFVAVSFTMDSFLYIAMFLIYPVNLYCVAGILCALGQNVMDSAHEMEVAIYDCDWHSAPTQFRRLILMFMIRCKKPITVEAKPFYILNFSLLTRMTNNVYMMVAVARNLF